MSKSSNDGSAVMKQSLENPNRYIFEFNGMKIYEWEQSLEDVTIYVNTPPGKTKASEFDIQIQVSKLRVGLKGHDRHFIDEETFDKVNTSESSWYLDEGNNVQCRERRIPTSTLAEHIQNLSLFTKIMPLLFYYYQVYCI